MATKENPKYYTMAEAKKILGIGNDALYNYVENGALERIIPPGKKQGVYRRDQVNQLARELRSFMMQRRKSPTQFERLKTREEMEKCQEISMSLFGVKRDIDNLLATVEKNPETYYILKDENEIVGYTAIWPVSKEKLNNILAQTLPVQITTDDIEVFVPGKSVDIYIVVIAVKPSFSKEERRSYGARLISGLAGVIESLGERGIPINTIAARSNMPSGIRLLKGTGFTEVKALTPERRTFIIEVEKSGTPFIQEYKRALEESTTTPINLPNLHK